MDAICFQMDGVTVELPHSQLRETSRGRTAPQKSRGQKAAAALPQICQSASGWLTQRDCKWLSLHTEHLRSSLETKKHSQQKL